MRKAKVIQKVAAITVIILLIVSCSRKESIHTFTEAATVTPTKDPTEISLTNRQEDWESYLYRLIKNREENLLYTQQDFEIDLAEYIKQGKISLQNDPAEIKAIINSIDSSFLIDIDHDGIDELYVIQCEGSIRQYYGTVFKKKNEVYVEMSEFKGHILPVRYNNDVHFISIFNNFETKHTEAVVEYEVNGLAFKPKEILNINYLYDVSAVSKLMGKMIDNEYLNSLSSYEISDSNFANMPEISNESSYDVKVTDEKYKNTFNWTIKLWLTSVGYAPNSWEISSKDESTHKFNGMGQIETNGDKVTDDSVLYGWKFFKDEFDQLFLIKVSYPFFTLEDRKDGDLILQLFKFNKDFVEEVEKVRIEPEVEVNYCLLSLRCN
ncbi:hypothetical protein [Paenibacillus sp. N3.4]|uniref:hypothetical protein n=1 Tax=Paenibacillus sp. N3.4 TaxID=2603222 RepID=UPI0011CA7740|nr:hypothetical protein [Paenibacillus sp. N3.4]TXK82612.1 hypothetical protein FU659_14875 [Paenibacillus sp. N3.4]